MGDLPQAVNFYEYSLAEHNNQDVLAKLNEIQADFERKLSLSSGINMKNNQRLDEPMRQRLAQLHEMTAEKRRDILLALYEPMRNQTFSEMFPGVSQKNFWDNRVQSFELDSYPASCDVEACQKRLKHMFEMTRFTKFYESYLKTKQFKPARIDIMKRLGNCLPQTLRWYAKCEIGSVNREFKDEPYMYENLHSYSNQALRPCSLAGGGVHVSVGFADLSLFYYVQNWEEWSREKPLKWVGYEASAYCVAKTAVVVAMIESGAAKEEIMQVWYSAAWSLGTLKSFRTAIKYLQNSKFFFFL